MSDDTTLTADVVAELVAALDDREVPHRVPRATAPGPPGPQPYLDNSTDNTATGVAYPAASYVLITRASDVRGTRNLPRMQAVGPLVL